jgi:hypothetical protein
MKMDIGCGDFVEGKYDNGSLCHQERRLEDRKNVRTLYIYIYIWPKGLDTEQGRAGYSMVR